ncbi:MAG: PIN domain-containing protein [Chloroflexia bacterium]|nr:PIN domain-containing protein [Chloroflexia bacterium]
MASTPRIGPTRVFVDASVLFSAARSPKGFARDLIEAGLRGQIELVLSPFVIEETRRNLSKKAPEALPLFEAFLAPDLIRVVQPSTALVAQVATVIVLKDAPVVAGAIVAEATLVATYDRKDLLSKRAEILAAFGVTVATPDEILANL